jgi:hypothetical protein
MRRTTIISKIGALEKAIAPSAPSTRPVTLEVTQAGSKYRHGTEIYTRADLDALKARNRALTIVVLHDAMTRFEYPNGVSKTVGIDWSEI